jgi:DNA-directed RNA polymerase subunit N (RpoN/RPB10)
MLIVIKCFTCNKVLADKWLYYERECKKLDDKYKETSDDQDGGAGTSNKGKELKNMDPKTRKEILDNMGLHRLCCRRHMLGCVDLMELI